MLVTSKVSMPDDEVYSTYHELWRIEESLKVMKSELDARPVYLQRDDAIAGHFLVCYLAVTPLRILQFKVLGDELERLANPTVNDYYLTGTQVKKIVGYRFDSKALKGTTSLLS